MTPRGNRVDGEEHIFRQQHINPLPTEQQWKRPCDQHDWVYGRTFSKRPLLIGCSLGRALPPVCKIVTGFGNL